MRSGHFRDYSQLIKKIMENYGLPTSGTKSSYIKGILMREFGTGVGFYTRSLKNQSEVVYDTSGGGSYIEAVISSMGISNEQLIGNIASRLRDEIRQIAAVPCPPQVIELEQQEELSPLLVQLISSLERSCQVEPDIKAHTLASLLTYYVTRKPTTT